MARNTRYDRDSIQDSLESEFEAEQTQLNEQGREEPYEPFGHCDSCGKTCDDSGECSCGGPIAIPY